MVSFCCSVISGIIHLYFCILYNISHWIFSWCCTLCQFFPIYKPDHKGGSAKAGMPGVRSHLLSIVCCCILFQCYLLCIPFLGLKRICWKAVFPNLYSPVNHASALLNQVATHQHILHGVVKLCSYTMRCHFPIRAFQSNYCGMEKVLVFQSPHWQ